MKKLLTIIIILTASYSGFFLDNGIGLKGAQLGGAGTAVVKGAEALYWNPANLADNQVSNNQAYISYGNKFDDVMEHTFLFKLVLSPESALGFGYYRLGVDNITKWDISSQNIGSMQFINEAMLVGYGIKLNSASRLGITAKNIAQKAVSLNSYQSVDIGYQTNMGICDLGIVAQDVWNNALGGQVKPVYRVGTSWKVIMVRLNVEYAYLSLLEKGYFKSGVIWNLVGIDLKVGYNDYDKNAYAGISFGMIDYLFTNNEVGTVHQFGLQIEL